MSQAEDNSQLGVSSQAIQPLATSSIAVPTSENARQRRRIADLEEKLQVLESGQAAKKRYEFYRRKCSTLTIIREINQIMSQGRAIRRIITLFDSIEDLIQENDRRCDNDDDDDVTVESVFHFRPTNLTLTSLLTVRIVCKSDT
jgi:hypothetical protein